MATARPVLRTLAAVLGVAAMAPAAPEGRVFYASPSGNDAWSGTLADAKPDETDGPFRTLAKAAAVLEPGDTLRLRKGTYRETLRPPRDGTPESPIAIEAHAGEEPVLSGADPLAGWERAEGGLFKAPLEWDLADQNQLFAGGVPLPEARWPNNTGTLFQPVRAVVESGSPATIVDPKLPGEDDFWKGALLWCAGGERWYCWTARVTRFDSKSKTLTFDRAQNDRWYTPRKGNEYVLMDARNALDAEGEWWVDRAAKGVWLKPPGGKDPSSLEVEARRRPFAMDLSGRSHLRVSGLRFRAGGILTDAKTAHVLLKRLRGEHVAHSFAQDVSEKAGVLIKGRHIELNGCEISGASGSLVRVEGNDNRLVNCFIHEGDYQGGWHGAVSLSGRRHIVSHCTIRDSGRDLVSIHGLMESLIQNNDLSDAGWLTADLGMTYGHNTDFMGTVIRHNWVHDNRARGHTAGIYFDHCSHNAIVHSNVVWNVPGMPLQVNNPSYFMLGYNNTFWKTGNVGTFDHSHRDDLFGMRFHNNISPGAIKLPDHVAKDFNLVDPKTPVLQNPERRRFGPRPGSPASGRGVPLAGVTAGRPVDIGAYPAGRPEWKVGHDFRNPPSPSFDVPEIAYSNAIRNAAFELGTIESWTAGAEGAAGVGPGNGWGNGFGRGKVEKTGTSRFELKLTGRGRVEQAISGLHPRTAYQLSGWLRTGDGKETVVLGVKDHGGPDATASSGETEWTRKTVDFTTGAGRTSVTVFVAKTSDGAAPVFADNLGLPRVPPAK